MSRFEYHYPSYPYGRYNFKFSEVQIHCEDDDPPFRFSTSLHRTRVYRVDDYGVFMASGCMYAWMW